MRWSRGQQLIGGIEKLATELRSPHNGFSRRSFLVGAGVVVVSINLVPFDTTKIASAASGSTLNFVAHEDDDLLFLSPDLLHAIQAGRTVRTVFLTAGDAGDNAAYWGGREAGAQAAYALMCGVANTWTQTDAGISGHPIPVFTLSAYPLVSLAFMRLPDGNLDGSGFSSTNYESLQDLWTGSITTIHAIDGSSSYTKATLTSTLAALMSSFLPDQVNMQDYVGTYGDGDHSDHHSAAYLVQAALQQYATPYSFTGYEDYNTAALAANVTGTDLTAKQNAFFTYAQDDANVCGSNSSCAGSNYALWLQRQYTVGSGTGGGNQAPVANAGANQAVQVSTTVQLDGSGSTGSALTYLWTQTAGTAVTLSSTTAVKPTFTAPASATTLTFQLVVNNGQTSSSPSTVTITVSSSSDLALFATATASSQNTSTAQTADKAIDGVIDGYPGDYTKEWATIGGGVGSWLKLTWASAQTANEIILYDRPNTDDQITGGNIQFSDGSSITIGALNNDGTATSFTFTAKTFTSLQFNITSVSASTQNVGLAEIQVYNNSSGGSQAPVANAGTSQSVQTGATVTLDGSGSSDPAGKTLTYLWTQTAGTTVTLSSTTAVKPTFTAPASATTLTFQLVVNNGQTTSSPSTVTITVTAAQAPVANAGTSQSVQTGATVTLDGSGSSDPAGKTLTYLWTQTAGTTVTLSSTTAVKPTFTAPASATTLTFQLVVNNGQTSSSPATVTITVSSPTTDLALSATATASSQDTSTGQTANKAIDGVIDGYPGDYTKEWATVGGKAGSWLKLTWASAQTIGRIVLYDRPNTSDQITAGNIQFSDGSSVTVGKLTNNGAAVTITFTAKTITSLQLNITAVSSSTQNVGLAEIQVYAS